MPGATGGGQLCGPAQMLVLARVRMDVQELCSVHVCFLYIMVFDILETFLAREGRLPFLGEPFSETAKGQQGASDVQPRGGTSSASHTPVSAWPRARHSGPPVAEAHCASGSLRCLSLAPLACAFCLCWRPPGPPRPPRRVSPLPGPHESPVQMPAAAQ